MKNQVVLLLLVIPPLLSLIVSGDPGQVPPSPSPMTAAKSGIATPLAKRQGGRHIRRRALPLEKMLE